MYYDVHGHGGRTCPISYSLTTVNALCNGGTGSITITNLRRHSTVYLFVER
ncbi:MAG: hypothetical protein IPP29_21170 [Bacteroidetes bacterium]|nr:hypothetical protein [Bacteroidota bacterium]